MNPYLINTMADLGERLEGLAAEIESVVEDADTGSRSDDSLMGDFDTLTNRAARLVEKAREQLTLTPSNNE
jgi:hypothetical protein